MTLTKKVFASMILFLICTFIGATPARAQLGQRCNWGVGALTPTVSPVSTQVMMMPVVMDFGGPPLGTSKVAFISFENASQLNRDGGGVLRIIDVNCKEIARFPDPSVVGLIPPNCPIDIFSHFLASSSGVAAGNVDTNPDVEIIAVLDEPTSNHKQIVAFNLFGGQLSPKWCSSPLPAGDFIPGTSAPAIAQLDGVNSSSAGLREIIIDNKVFNANGALRYTGFNFGGNNCAASGGPPCPRSRTVAVANVLGPNLLPQVITGRGLYQSSINNSNSLWTGTLSWWNPIVQLNNTSPPLAYSAVAEIVGSSPGPEIVVTDTMQTTVRVLSSVTGVQLASAPLPNPGYIRCGGPPMIGDADGVLGPEIGVASCSRYTLFKYNGTNVLAQVWSIPISDPSGQTTSTLFNNPTGRRIFHADQYTLRVINGMNGNVIQSIPNSSGTAVEGPVIAAFDSGLGVGALILVANNYLIGSAGQKGVRIFDDTGSTKMIGHARNCWSGHAYHVTNLTDCLGAIPIVEPASWLTPASNTYRVQQ